jgi:hypothetical protein
VHNSAFNVDGTPLSSDMPFGGLLGLTGFGPN